MVKDQPRQLKPATQGADRRGQVEGQIAGLEGWLSGFEIPKGPDLRQEHGLATGGLDKGFGQGPRAATGRG
jgi:hypothetical protein